MERRRDSAGVLDCLESSIDEKPVAEIDEEPDLLPEQCTYRDEGCELAISCLNCPFPNCVLEQPGGKQRWLRRNRDREIVRLYTSEGKGTKELAERFGVNPRTVQRVLRRAKK